MIGVICGSLFFEVPLFKSLKKETVKTEFGDAEIFSDGNICFIARHGSPPAIPPHKINHKANISALKKAGCSHVIGVCSTGSLNKAIKPGDLALVTDFIGLFSPITFFDKKIVHDVPLMGAKTGNAILKTASSLGIPIKKGVYVQTPGPRLETKAEVRLLSQFADIVGMTASSEATLCSEAGLDYSCVCSIDNYAHGLAEEELSNKAIVKAKNANAEKVKKLVLASLEEMQ